MEPHHWLLSSGLTAGKERMEKPFIWAKDSQVEAASVIYCRQLQWSYRCTYEPRSLSQLCAHREQIPFEARGVGMTPLLSIIHIWSPWGANQRGLESEWLACLPLGGRWAVTLKPHYPGSSFLWKMQCSAAVAAALEVLPGSPLCYTRGSLACCHFGLSLLNKWLHQNYTYTSLATLNCHLRVQFLILETHNMT